MSKGKNTKKKGAKTIAAKTMKEKKQAKRDKKIKRIMGGSPQCLSDKDRKPLSPFNSFIITYTKA
ncbi:MAG: hypothetical protein AB8G77_03765 [Rhodothermales bacterium]